MQSRINALSVARILFTMLLANAVTIQFAGTAASETGSKCRMRSVLFAKK